MNVRKSSQLGKSMVSVRCTNLFEHVSVRTSCFDTYSLLQIKLIKLPLIHCFGCG